MFYGNTYVTMLDSADNDASLNVSGKKNGGERGIRTLVRVSPKHAFQACAFNHSAISPRGWNNKFSARRASAHLFALLPHLFPQRREQNVAQTQVEFGIAGRLGVASAHRLFHLVAQRRRSGGRQRHVLL